MRIIIIGVFAIVLGIGATTLLSGCISVGGMQHGHTGIG